MNLLNKRKRHPNTVDPQGIWVMRMGAADLVGISQGAMLLLQRDKVFPPDCSACGRIRWMVDECYMRRDELRRYLKETYPNDIDELILTDT